MFKIEIYLSVDGTTFERTVERNTIDEIKRDEGDFIIELAKDNGLKGELYSETVITEDEEYYDSDSDYIYIYEDYSGFEIVD